MTFFPVNDGKLGGRFAVEREVGRGGAGIVFRAFDLITERAVALKVINSEVGVAPEEEARLMREGQLLENLDHPGIVKTVAFGVLEDTGAPFVAMEWLDGEDLAPGSAAIRSAFRKRSSSRSWSVTRSARRTPRASSTAISSPATFSSARNATATLSSTAGRSSWTSAWR